MLLIPALSSHGDGTQMERFKSWKNNSPNKLQFGLEPYICTMTIIRFICFSFLFLSTRHHASFPLISQITTQVPNPLPNSPPPHSRKKKINNKLPTALSKGGLSHRHVHALSYDQNTPMEVMYYALFCRVQNRAHLYPTTHIARTILSRTPFSNFLPLPPPCGR
jgi:hypothetical protein